MTVFIFNYSHASQTEQFNLTARKSSANYIKCDDWSWSVFQLISNGLKASFPIRPL